MPGVEAGEERRNTRSTSRSPTSSPRRVSSMRPEPGSPGSSARRRRC